MTSRFRFLLWRLTHPRRDRLRREIVAWAEENGIAEDDAEVREIVEFLRGHPLHHFPYPFVERYEAEKRAAEFDPEAGLYYVTHDGKRLYWREGRKAKRIPGDYTALLCEQDRQSPHRYLAADFDVEPGDVVADIGCAEGNFSLDVVERAGHVYLFEADDRWVPALKATFRPWQEKVTIVPKLVGSETSECVTTLDDFFAERRAPDFLKLDVEGFEAPALEGARNLLSSGHIQRVAVCSYHQQKDESELGRFLRDHGFAPSASRGYMLMYRQTDFGPPYFRRGLLRAVKRGEP